jgi:hypothetical protein
MFRRVGLDAGYFWPFLASVWSLTESIDSRAAEVQLKAELDKMSDAERADERLYDVSQSLSYRAELYKTAAAMKPEQYRWVAWQKNLIANDGLVNRLFGWLHWEVDPQWVQLKIRLGDVKEYYCRLQHMKGGARVTDDEFYSIAGHPVAQNADYLEWLGHFLSDMNWQYNRELGMKLFNSE